MATPPLPTRAPGPAISPRYGSFPVAGGGRGNAAGPPPGRSASPGLSRPQAPTPNTNRAQAMNRSQAPPSPALSRTQAPAPPALATAQKPNRTGSSPPPAGSYGGSDPPRSKSPSLTRSAAPRQAAHTPTPLPGNTPLSRSTPPGGITPGLPPRAAGGPGTPGLPPRASGGPGTPGLPPRAGGGPGSPGLPPRAGGGPGGPSSPGLPPARAGGAPPSSPGLPSRTPGGGPGGPGGPGSPGLPPKLPAGGGPGGPGSPGIPRNPPAGAPSPRSPAAGSSFPPRTAGPPGGPGGPSPRTPPVGGSPGGVPSTSLRSSHGPGGPGLPPRTPGPPGGPGAVPSPSPRSSNGPPPERIKRKTSQPPVHNPRPASSSLPPKQPPRSTTTSSLPTPSSLPSPSALPSALPPPISSIPSPLPSPRLPSRGGPGPGPGPSNSPGLPPRVPGAASPKAGPLPPSLSPGPPVALPSPLANSQISQERREEIEKEGRMRMSVVKEFIETERDYINDVEVLTNVFIFPLKATQMLPKTDIEVLFSNIEDVVPIHVSFLKQLEQKVTEQKESGQPQHDVQLGDIFVRFFHYFKLYSIYASNQDASLERLEKVKKKKDVKSFLDIAHNDSRCKGNFLNSYLIKPIQRLCKYPLLLRELIKYTPETHPDREALKETADKVNSVVNFVNEAKRKEEGAQRTKALAEKFGIKDLVRDDRLLHKEGEVFELKKGKKNPPDPRYLFVFSDLILVMKPTKKNENKQQLHYKKIASADLSKTKIVNIGDLPEEGVERAFEIYFDGEKILFSATTEQEKIVWVKTINKCIKEFQKQAAFQLKKAQEAEGASPSPGQAATTPRDRKGSRPPMMRKASKADMHKTAKRPSIA